MENIAAFTDLAGAGPAENCEVITHDGGSLRLNLPHRVVVGNPVKIEAQDTLALGEVTYCQPAAEGYVVWVEVLEQLQNLTELARLARALVGDAATGDARRCEG